MKNEIDLRKLAEDHWRYTEKILDKERELQRLLSIEVAIHFYKHGVEDTLKDHPSEGK